MAAKRDDSGQYASPEQNEHGADPAIDTKLLNTVCVLYYGDLLPQEGSFSEPSRAGLEYRFSAPTPALGHIGSGGRQLW